MSTKGRGLTSTVAERVSIVYTMLLDGYTRTQIIRANSEWGVSERTIDDYIAKARDEIREINREEREDNRATILRNLWILYDKSVRVAEFGDAHKIIMSIAKLTGLDEQVVHHTISERPYQSLSREERREQTDKLLNGKH